jgi:hypothetical protein
MSEKPPSYDPAALLTGSALFFVGILILFVAAIIGVQIWRSGEANTESWAALTGLIGWATSQVSVIFNNRYGTTQQSARKDETIQDLTKTASVIAQTTQATQAATAISAPPVPGQPITASEVSIDATGAAINIDKGTKS